MIASARFEEGSVLETRFGLFSLVEMSSCLLCVNTTRHIGIPSKPVPPCFGVETEIGLAGKPLLGCCIVPTSMYNIK